MDVVLDEEEVDLVVFVAAGQECAGCEVDALFEGVGMVECGAFEGHDSV